MDYTKLITKKRQYKYSVNICFDLRDAGKLADFIPNVTTTEILREYLGGIIRGNAKTHSRILYGAYGTGKSHLLTVLSAVLGQINTVGKGYKTFLQLLKKYDGEIVSDIEDFVEKEKPYMIVPVYSDFEDFGKCITFSLKKELERGGIGVCFHGFFDESLMLVEKWLSGEESSMRLKEECKKQGIEVDELKRGLSTYDLLFENIFNKIYEGMSYGAVFNSTAGNLIDNLNLANEAIREKYRGIILVFDEFGRYVEDYGEAMRVKTLQDLAEYCDHSGYDTHLILVSHKQLSLYTSGMKRSVSDEWKKVEGRFKPTSINSKYDQCLSLIQHIIPKTGKWNAFKKKFVDELNNLYNQAWDFKGFLLSPETKGESPFENGFPLHPITLFALDRLSKKVAQNERTFFTYLAGDETNALFAQLTKYDLDEFHFVGLDEIYDYFELNIKAFKTDEAYVSYKKLHYALNKLGEDTAGCETRVLKVIAVINIIADTDILAADKDTITSVIDCDKEKISEAIDALEKKKIIKFMRQYGFYNFFDSSIFDLESMIEEKLSGISDEMVVGILNEDFADFALYPYSYNERYHVNRVFIPVFVQKESLCTKTIHNILPEFYDGAVVFVMDGQADEKDYENIEELPERTLLIVDRKSKTLEVEVKRYIAIQYYFSKKDELAKDDPTVIDELKLYLIEQRAIVIELIRKWRTLYDKGSFVVMNSEIMDISSEKELTELLSMIAGRAFPRTLIVNNDLLNKNVLTGAIKQARKKALEGIMGKGDMYERCTFLSPEYNILRATLSKNGISKDNKVEKQELNRFENGQISGEPIMVSIRDLLSKAESEHLALTELYRMLKSEPYGVRDGYIPVLIAYALRDYQNVSLYFHGNEHSYNPDELVKALSEPENYSLYICNWNDEQIAYIEALERIFWDYLPKGETLNRLEELFKAINTHYSSISKSARTTDIYISDKAKAYREILNLSYKDYNAFFFDILPGLNGDLQELSIQIENIKKDLESVTEKQYKQVVKVVKQIFGLNDFDELMPAVVQIYKEQWENKKLKAFDYTTNGVLELLEKADENKEEQFINALAKQVSGLDLTYWTDNKIIDFEETLQRSIDKLNGYNPEAELQEGETKVTIESFEGNMIVSQFSQDELSVKGQTLLNKVKSAVNSFGDSIKYEEKIYIMTEILKEIIN